MDEEDVLAFQRDWLAQAGLSVSESSSNKVPLSL
jgi:hypothetical protein